MLDECKSLFKLDLSSFNPQNFNDMSNMFNGCKNLIKINFLSFGLLNKTNDPFMFNYCDLNVFLLK